MDDEEYGWWTDLATLKFADAVAEGDNMVLTFQAFPYGKYSHPIYGEIDFDANVAKDAASGVNTKVRGQDLDIDYDHKQYSGEAAGWVKAAEARSSGLWLTVKWTKNAFDKIKEGAYRYFSPEIAKEWKHPQTGIVHKNVLFGGGITNRPFLKGILPLNLSEIFEAEAEEPKNTGEESGMDPKKLRKLLGLPEDATDDAVNEALNKVPDNHVIMEAPIKDAPIEPVGPPNEVVPIAASEDAMKEVIRLAETSSDPTVKALVGLVDGLHKQVSTTTAALQMSETNNLVRQLSEPKNGKMLSAGAAKLLADALVTPSQDAIRKFAEGVEYVPVGEVGGSGDHGNQDGESAVKKFTEIVNKMVAEDKMSFGDATEVAAKLHPQLFNEYRAGSYAFVENTSGGN